MASRSLATGSARLIVALAIVCNPVAAQAAQPATTRAAANECRTCHPGATKGLADTPHLALGNRCVACHTGAATHAKSATDPMASRVAAGRVLASACVACHQQASYPTDRAEHSWRRTGRRTVATTPTQTDPLAGSASAPPVQPPPEPVFDWAAAATLGYRFIDLTGSRDRFATDFNLDSGLRLSAFRFDGHFTTPTPYLDRIHIEANDIADPYERVRGFFEKDGLYRAGASFRRSRYTYKASGEFHRVDRKNQVAAYDLTLPMANGWELFANFSRSDQDGYWLTNRIGDRNLTPLTTINGVRSPRRTTEDEVEIGVTASLGDTTMTLVGEYLDQNEDNGWTYSQPAVANPAFTESEDTQSGSSLEGPGGRLDITHKTDALDAALSARLLDRRRRIVGTGVTTGFDTAEFNTTTRSLSEGAARTLLVDGTVSYALADTLDFHSELRWLEHKEHLRIDQSDVTVFPTLPSTVTVLTQLDQRTVSRVREATAELEWQVVDALLLTGGWGWSQEKLRLPDLQSFDNDFTRGTVVEDGYILGAHWRPDAHWTVRGRYREFGQGGPQLHDVIDNHTRRATGRVKYRDDNRFFEFAIDNRRSQNPVSDSRTSNTSYTLSTGYNPGANLSCSAGYTLSNIDSRTRTTFYFNPTPTPVSTLVGFKGETQTFHGSLHWDITERLRAAAHGSYTTVHGDFELDLYQWNLDLSVQIDPGRAGVRLEQVDYHEAGNPDDYDAFLVFVYYSFEL